MWRGAGSASPLRLPRQQVCPGEAGAVSAAEAVLMVLPSQLSWREARDQCRIELETKVKRRFTKI